LADKNDLLAITKRINGGTNGLADRYQKYDKVALNLLGYSSILEFQKASGFKGKALDGLSGPKTRAALHSALSKAPLVSFGEPQSAPVTSTKTPGIGGMLDILTAIALGTVKVAQKLIKR